MGCLTGVGAFNVEREFCKPRVSFPWASNVLPRHARVIRSRKFRGFGTVCHQVKEITCFTSYGSRDPKKLWGGSMHQNYWGSFSKQTDGSRPLPSATPELKGGALGFPEEGDSDSSSLSLCLTLVSEGRWMGASPVQQDTNPSQEPTTDLYRRRSSLTNGCKIRDARSNIYSVIIRS